MRTICFITNNQGKFKEIKNFLKVKNLKLKQIKFDLEELQSVDARKIIRHKAEEAIKNGYCNFFIEDTSLYINGLGRLPGPLIKWFLLELGNHKLYKLAKTLGSREARAETIIAYVGADRAIRYFRGATDGVIVQPQGNKDFGWGPIFKPIGAIRTFGQMSYSEKYKWSMRAKTFQKFIKFIQ